MNSIIVMWDPPAESLYVKNYRMYYSPSHMYDQIQYAMQKETDGAETMATIYNADPYYGYSVKVQAQSIYGLWGELTDIVSISQSTPGTLNFITFSP